MNAQTPPENPSENPTAALIIIGNEILSGRTQDANLAHVARRLTQKGITLAEVRVIPDVIGTIAETINQLRARHAHVFTTGGIGPTHDDLTAVAVAAAFDVPLERNEEAVALLAAHYDDPATLNEARLSMADMPVGARIIHNPVSRAPGFSIENVHVLAGVPRIMEAMFDGLLPSLVSGAPVLSRSLSAYVAEGEIADALAEIQSGFPDVEMGSYPYFQKKRFGVSVVLRGIDQNRLDAAAAQVAEMFDSMGAQIHDDPP